MIAWTPLLPPQVRARYFVSYRSLHRNLAERVEAGLVAAGQEVWRDRKNLDLGDDWQLEIQRALGDCNDVVLLLTPEAAASEQVMSEIETAIELGKRVHCFATFDVRDTPAVYRLLQHINFERAPSAAPVGTPGSELPIFASYIVDTLLRPPRRAHPLDLRDFERRACRSVFPPFLDIWSGGRLNTSLAERYGEFAGQLAAERSRCTAALALNAGILSGHLQQWQSARTHLDVSLRLEPSAVALYFQVLARMRGVRPRHLSGAATDECVAAALQSWERAKSPLIALLMVAVLWDSGRGRGANLARLWAEAMRALPSVECGSGEIGRFLALMPFERGWDLPCPTDEMMELLARLTGDEQ